MRTTTCLGIPVVDGTVVIATYASRRLLGNTAFAGAAVTVQAAVAADGRVTAADLEHACRLQARRFLLQSDGATAVPSRRGGELFLALPGMVLGLALIVASLGFWLPATAGVWLLAFRPWLLARLRRRRPTAVSESPSIAVRRVAHSGIGALREVIGRNLEENLAYAEAYEVSRRLGIKEAADLYTRLLLDPRPSALAPEAGLWLPDATTVREVLAQASLADDEGLESIEDEIKAIDAEILDADFEAADEAGPVA